jgi:hypothetical protein
VEGARARTGPKGIIALVEGLTSEREVCFKKTCSDLSDPIGANGQKTKQEIYGEDGMANKISLPSSWTCDGKELKPKSGARLSNTWVFDGKEIKPKSSASLSNTWVWNGTELKPKSGAKASNTWVVAGNKVKPKSGASLSNSYDCGGENILVIAGKVALRLY